MQADQTGGDHLFGSPPCPSCHLLRQHEAAILSRRSQAFYNERVVQTRPGQSVNSTLVDNNEYVTEADTASIGEGLTVNFVKVCLRDQRDDM